MRLTRRGLFAAIAAAFVAKPAIEPAVEGLPLAFVRSFDRSLIRCECPNCQYARGFIKRGGYEFYPDAFVLPSPKIGDTIVVRKPRRMS